MKRLARGRTVGRYVGMNKTEAEHAANLTALKSAGKIIDFKFDHITIKIADDTRYTPDFWVMLADRTIEFHEVKGWMFEDDALVKIKVASEQCYWAVFRAYIKQSKKNGGGWKVREFGPDSDVEKSG